MPNESIGGISVSISVGLQDLQAQFEQAQQMATQAGQAMASAFNSSSTAASGLSSSLQEVGSSLTPLLGLGLALAPISAGIVEAGKNALEAAGKFEQWQVSFTQLLGSATAAKSMIEDLVNFATRTPFEIPDVVSNAQRLMAFGFAARDVIPILTSLGDAVSGLGKGAASLNSLVLAFGEMEAKGVVQLRQLNMLTNQGIPAIELLAKAYNVNVTQMTDAISKKLVPAAEAIPVLLAGITEKFGGMMDKQSQTFLGMLSNLSDAAMKTFAAIGNTMLPVAKDLEQFGFSALNSLTDLAKAFEALPVPVQEAAIALAAVGAAAAPVALALGAIGLAITSIGAALPVLIPLAGILGGIAAGIALIHFADVDTEALHFFQTLRDGFDGLKDLVSGATDTIRSFGTELKALSSIVPGVDLAWEAIGKFAESITTVKQAILILMPPLDAARVAFTTLGIATEYLSGNYKSMDAAQKAVNASLAVATRATVDATGPATALGGAIGGVTDHLVLGTKAHADHAGAVSSTATAYKNWNDQVSAALGLGPGNVKITQDLGAAFKYLGDQVAAADELWKHYIVDAGQALSIMDKGTGVVGGFTISMENGVEMIKGSKEAIQSTSGTILDFTTIEGQATSAADGLTSSLGTQTSSFSNLGVTAQSSGRHVREALTGMEDGFRATTGQVSALSVGVAFLAMQLSGLTIFAGSGGIIDQNHNAADLQHQLYLAKQMAGDPSAQPFSFSTATGGAQKGQSFSSLDDLNQALSDLQKTTDAAATSTEKLSNATAKSTQSTLQYVDGVGNIYDSYQKMIDAIAANPNLGGLWHTIDTASSAATSLTRATQATTAAQQQFVDGLGNVYDSYQALTAAIAANPLLGGPATSSTGDKLSGPSSMPSTMAEALANMTKLATPNGATGDSKIPNVLGTFNGQVITGSPGMSLSDAIALMHIGVGSGSGAVTALPGSMVTSNGTSNYTPVPSNQQGGQGIVVNMNYPSFNSQQQADQVMKQVVTQLRTVTGLKL